MSVSYLTVGRLCEVNLRKPTFKIISSLLDICVTVRRFSATL